jgi:hypothetical protein
VENSLVDAKWSKFQSQVGAKAHTQRSSAKLGTNHAPEHEKSSKITPKPKPAGERRLPPP